MDSLVYGQIIKKINQLLDNAKTKLSDDDYKGASEIFTNVSDAYLMLAEQVGVRNEEYKLKKKAIYYRELANEYRYARVKPKTPKDGSDKKKSEHGESEDFSELKSIISQLVHQSKITFKDIGGLDETKRELCFSLAMSVAQAPANIKLDSWRNILFYGPPGTGKTLLAAATSNALTGNDNKSALFYNVKVSNLLSKYFGESSKLISILYDTARETTPSVIFLDEFESLAPSRDKEGSGSERRILSTLLAEMDGLSEKDMEDVFVITIAATNRPWDLDSAILSRFDKQIYIPLPDKLSREKIFKIHLVDKGWPIDVPIDYLVELTDGLSGREIASMIKNAIGIMLIEENQGLFNINSFNISAAKKAKIKLKALNRTDFNQARKKIVPQTKEADIKLYEKFTG